MNNNHNIKDLDLLYSDAKKLIDEIISEKIDGYELKNINSVINDVKEHWHGQDAMVQVNKLIETKNLLIDNRDMVGNLAIYISMLAKNYRDAQNANGTILSSFLQLNYKKIEKDQKLTGNIAEIYMNNSISNCINTLKELIVKVDEINNSVVAIKTSILNNWIQEDANRNYAIKIFNKFTENSAIIVKNYNDIIKCITTAIENYNKSLNSVDSMPSLESMVNLDINPAKEYTMEQQVVLDSIEKNFEDNKKLNDAFNQSLVNEVKKELESKGGL